MRRAAFDICMTDTKALDIPMELSVELMAITGSDLSYQEWGPVDNVIDKVDCVSLGMRLVDLEGANAGGVINGGIL